MSNQFLDLSPEEKRICRLLADGCTMKEIAALLDVSVVNLHGRIKRTRYRSGCRSILRLVVRYLEEYCGVLDPLP